MKYLELDELFLGATYQCQFYEDSDKVLELVYMGCGTFTDTEFSSVYDVYGDIRYVNEVGEKLND